MFLKIIPSRHKKTKNLYVRGSYLRVRVDESTGTDDPELARKVLKRIEREIERGERTRFLTKPVKASGAVKFATAARKYLEAGHRPRYVQALVDYFKGTPIGEIDQEAIDECAATLYPNVSNASRNAYVYTPVSAVLHHAKVKITVARPKGAKGKIKTDWLIPPDAFGIIKAADTFDRELGTLLMFLLYTGSRIGAALKVNRNDILLDEGAMWARPEKGQDANAIKLHPELRERLAEHLANHNHARVFRWNHGGTLQFMLTRAKLIYLGIPCPERRPHRWTTPPHRLSWVAFHTWRHTFASWMRRYGGATIDDLLDSGNWKDRRVASRYVHAKPDGIWDKVEQLPAMGKKRA